MPRWIRTVFGWDDSFYAAAIGAPPPPLGGEGARGERGATNAKARRDMGWEPRYPTWRAGFRVALA